MTNRTGRPMLPPPVMHYCFLTVGNWEGNASIVRSRELGTSFLRLRSDVTISYVISDTPYNRGNLGLDPKAKIEFIPPGSKLQQTKARRAALARLAPDYVHIINPSPYFWMTLAGTRWKVVSDYDEWPARRPYPLPRRTIEKFLDRWHRRRASIRVVASHYMQDEFRARFGMESVYLPYATYLGARDRNVPNPYAEPTAVYMGNLYPAYDHDLLIDAAVILKQRGKLPAIKILGGAPDIEAVRKQIRDLGVRIDLPGYLAGDDLWRHLVHAHVLVFPIRPTILNLARCPSKTFAYAQTGRPVIANAVGEVVEVLGRGNDWPRYVDPTPQAFADALERAMDEPRAPDVDYHLEHQNWDERAKTLLEAIDRDQRGENPYVME